MKNIGMLLLGLWLIGTGLKTLLHLSFTYDAIVFAAIAVVAGVLIVLRR